MLDVHAPHEPIHTWKSFLIHIAAIVVGLIIAVGLEQTVEYVHHRHQAAEMVSRLLAETRSNQAIVDLNAAAYDATLAAIAKNVTALNSLHDFSAAQAPLEPIPKRRFFPPVEVAWITVRDSALLPIMPRELIEKFWKLDAIHELLSSWTSEAYRARIRLTALIEMHSNRRVASPEERDRLLLALAEYRECLSRYRALLAAYDGVRRRVLSGQPADIETDPTWQGDEGAVPAQR